MEDVDVAIVGAGPAGIAAAVATGLAGSNAVLIDRDSTPGGQVFRLRHQMLSRGGPIEADGERLLDQLDRTQHVTFLGDTAVWDVSPETGLGLSHGGKLTWLKPRAIVLAPGAHERVVPFEGWTTPGVMTLGAIHRALHEGGRLPGQRFVFLGTGPLLYMVASHVVRHGGLVKGVLDVQPAPAVLSRTTMAFWQQTDMIMYGAGLIGTLLKNRVPIRFGWTVRKVTGKESVETVHMEPIRGSGRFSIDVDADVVGVDLGLLPRFELAALAGGKVEFDNRLSGFVIAQQDGANIAPGIFLAGDGHAIGGYRLAMLEGSLVGKEAAHWAQRSELTTEGVRLHHQIRRARRRVTRLFELPDEIWHLPEQTVVCRCERVTRHDLEQAIAAGAQSFSELRLRTRAGMGLCQGRNCRCTIAKMLQQAGIPFQAPRVRPPVEPLPLHSFVDSIPGTPVENPAVVSSACPS